MADPLRILFVCSGNTCRSPMAAALFQQEASAGGIEAVVRSAGLYAHSGEAVAEHAVQVMREECIELGGHAAVQVSVDDLRWAHAVVSVTEAQADTLREDYPELESRILFLSRDVRDPYRGSLADYREARERLRTLVLDAMPSIIAVATKSRATGGRNT